MKILGKILAVFYTIFFTFVLLAFILIATASSYLKEDFYTNLITSKEFMNTKLTDLKIEELDFDGKEEIMEICGKDCTVEDTIIAAATEGFGISEDLAREALNDKDVQKTLGELASFFINSTTTGKMEKLDYADYEEVLEKDVVEEILAELDYTKEDIKKIIDEYNKSVDRYYSNGGYGGVQVEQSIATKSTR